MKRTYGCNHEDVPDPFGRTFPTKIHRGTNSDDYNLENKMVFLDAKVVLALFGIES